LPGADDGTAAGSTTSTLVPERFGPIHPPGAESALTIGRHTLEVEGVQLSFRVPTDGWRRVGSLYLSKSSVGPQGAEAIIYWTTIDGGTYARPCGQWWGAPPGSAFDYAVSASMGQGRRIETRPVRAMVGGFPGAHVAFTVLRDDGCDPGYFYRWRPVDGGAFWTSTEVGDVVRIWIVDVGETRIFIEGDTHRGASDRLAREVERIVESIRFG
jgi:hypothetical protein